MGPMPVDLLSSPVPELEQHLARCVVDPPATSTTQDSESNSSKFMTKMKTLMTCNVALVYTTLTCTSTSFENLKAYLIHYF